MATDPLAPIISALSNVVTPDPQTIGSPPQAPSAWEPPNTTTNGTLYNTLQPFLNLLFGITQLQPLGSGLNTALTDVATVLSNLADKLANPPTGTTVADASAALNQALTQAEAVLPSDVASQLSSVTSSLVTTLQNAVTAVGSLNQAAAEIAQLSQQFTALAALFPTQ